MRQFKEQLKLLTSHKIGYFLVLAIFMTAFTFFLSYEKNDNNKNADNKVQESPDTFIPEGYVLVPIMVSNFESLNALVSQYAIVNLYAVNDTSNFHLQSSFSQMKKQVKTVAERIKLIRSPLNPERFAVLSPESQAEALITYNGEFFVTIQNPTITEQVSVKKDIKTRSLIDYLEEAPTEKKGLSE